MHGHPSHGTQYVCLYVPSPFVHHLIHSTADLTGGKEKVVPWKNLRRIAVRYGLEITNWTFASKPIQEPSNIGIKDLARLLNDLQSCKCHWQHMSDDAHEALLEDEGRELMPRQK